MNEATILWERKFVLFFMERIWPRSQRTDDALMERLEDLERRFEALEMESEQGTNFQRSG